MDLFKSWLVINIRRIWFRFTLATLFTTLIALPSIFGYIFNVLREMIGLESINTDYQLFNLAFNLIATIIAIFFLTPYKKHFNAKVLLKYLNHEISKNNEPFDILNINGTEILRNAKHAIKIHRYFLCSILIFYGSIGALYLIFICKLFTSDTITKRIFDIFEIGISYFSAIVLLSIYYRITYYMNDKYVSNKKTVLAILLFILIIIIQTFAIDMNRYWEAINLWTHGFTGVLVGVSFALVIGKLDSKMVSTPTWVLILMYLYAVLQAMFVFFGNTEICPGLHDNYKDWILYPSLFLKLLMFIFFMWLIRKNRIILHVLFSPIIDRKVNADMIRLENVLMQTEEYLLASRQK